MARLNTATALDILAACHVPQCADFHTLTTAQVESLVEYADSYGYRKPRGANGSRARYFHAYLTRQANGFNRARESGGKGFRRAWNHHNLTT